MDDLTFDARGEARNAQGNATREKSQSNKVISRIPDLTYALSISSRTFHMFIMVATSARLRGRCFTSRDILYRRNAIGSTQLNCRQMFFGASDTAIRQNGTSPGSSHVIPSTFTDIPRRSQVSPICHDCGGVVIFTFSFFFLAP